MTVRPSASCTAPAVEAGELRRMHLARTGMAAGAALRDEQLRALVGKIVALRLRRRARRHSPPAA